MKRSVATHTIGVKAPPLDNPDLVLKGAGHYELGCRPCHGSPGLNYPRIAHMMTPHPPYLPPRIGGWEPKELFYIVKHGVKFTGMPAWPALHRDDEIWAMVAFLNKLPELDEAGYRHLVHGESRPTTPIEALGGAEQVPKAALESCARCHGYDGIARGTGAFPHLAGQRVEYLQNSLESYANSRRHSGIMQPIAANLDAETIRALSHYFAAQRPADPPPPDEKEAAAVARGKIIAHQGIPEQRLPSCMDCHSTEGRHHKPAYPSLSGQPADYLELQLQLLSKAGRGGSEYVHLMHAVAPRMKPEQMRDVALYFQSLHHGDRTQGDPRR
ncbi:MAG: c-type cytochrome [Verrucomicrobiaceae bacterium]|nr:MAG: c-type cytochrome [Verrucomicrobiaceae bacterium]